MGSFGIFDLTDFDAFMIRQGYVSEATTGEYEVARYRMPDMSGTHNPVLVYRKKRGDLTVWPNGNEVNYLIDAPHAFARKMARVVKIDAGNVTTETPSKSDVPW